MNDLRDHYLAIARAELAQAKANTCSHGINRKRAVCRVCDEPIDEEKP